MRASVEIIWWSNVLKNSHALQMRASCVSCVYKVLGTTKRDKIVAPDGLIAAYIICLFDYKRYLTIKRVVMEDSMPEHFTKYTPGVRYSASISLA